MHPLRRRLEQSRTLARIVAAPLAAYLRLCQYSTRWQVEGLDELRADLARGPVIIVTWHTGVLLSPAQWPRGAPKVAILRDNSPMGLVSASVQEMFGFVPIAMSERASNISASRQVLRLLAEGKCLGLTADGPLGPGFVLKEAPLDWARAAQRPVWVMGWGVRRHRRLATWDKMIMPLPFTRGVAIWRRWRDDLPRKPDAAESEALRTDFAAALNAVTDDAMTRALA